MPVSASQKGRRDSSLAVNLVAKLLREGLRVRGVVKNLTLKSGMRY